MVSTPTPACDFGWPAAPFVLPGVDGHDHSLESVRGPKGLLVMFICNHCPYVQAILPRLLADIRALRKLGIGSVAIMSNDTLAYPEDSWEHMQALAHNLDFPCPYVLDARQEVARRYGAVCTPDFFGFNDRLELQYRGRFDASRKESAPVGSRPDLRLAMHQIALTGKGPEEQIPGMGCSIKWRHEPPDHPTQG